MKLIFSTFFEFSQCGDFRTGVMCKERGGFDNSASKRDFACVEVKSPENLVDQSIVSCGSEASSEQ